MVAPVLLECLTQAASQDPVRLQAAEEQLKAWKTQPNYYRALADVVRASQVDPVVRTLAIIQIKNGIDRYWRRSTAPGMIPASDQQYIRETLLGILGHEPLAPLLTRQATRLLALVARKDFSLVWPDAVEQLLALYQGIPEALAGNPDAVVAVRLQTMDAVARTIKNISSKSLGRDRIKFEQVATATLPALVDIYEGALAAAPSTLGQSAAPTSWSLALFAVKGIRRLVVHGISAKTSPAPAVETFLAKLVPHMRQLYALYRAAPDTPDSALVYRLLRVDYKLLLDLHQHHPDRFLQSDWSLAALEFAWEIISELGPRIPRVSTPDDAEALPTELIIQTLTLFQRVVDNPQLTVRSRAYDSAQDGATRPDDRLVATRVLTEPFVAHFAETLLHQYLILTPLDLQRWTDEPETWFEEERNEQSDVSIRARARSVFVGLVARFRTWLLPILQRRLNASLEGGDAVKANTVSTDVQATDAFYASVGIAVYELGNAIDFDRWLTTRLLPETQTPGPYACVLRWRIAWLIGQLSETQLARETRVEVYAALARLTGPDQHLLVRLSGAATLRAWLDNLEFYPHDFTPYLEPILQHLGHLLEGLEEPAAQKEVVRCLAIVAERMESAVAPAATAFVHLLYSLWDRCQETLLRNEIVVALVHLVISLGPLSVELHRVLLPILQRSIDPAVPDHDLLQVDAFDLWMVTLRQAPLLTPAMLEALPLALAHNHYEDEVAVQQLDVYLQVALFDPTALVQTHGAAIFRFLSQFISPDLERTLPLLCALLHVVFQRVDPTIFAPMLLDSGLLTSLVNYVLDTDGIRPNQVMISGVLSRLFIHAPEFVLAQLPVETPAPSLDTALESSLAPTLTTYITRWIDIYDGAYDARARKLEILAMVTVFRSCRPDAVQQLPAFAALWSSFLSEFHENVDGYVPAYYKDTNPPDSELRYASDCDAFTGRWSKLIDDDITLRVSTAAAIRDALGHAEGVFNGGPAEFQAWLRSTVDPTILDELLHLVFNTAPAT